MSVLVDFGSIAWLIAGRNWGERSETVAARASRPGSRKATNPDDDEEFLATLRGRTEEQRRRENGPGRDTPPAG